MLDKYILPHIKRRREVEETRREAKRATATGNEGGQHRLEEAREEYIMMWTERVSAIKVYLSHDEDVPKV